MYNNQNRYNGGYDDLFQKLSKEYVWKEATNRLTWFERYYERCYAGKIPSQVPQGAPVLIKELKNKSCLPIKYTPEFPPLSIDEPRRHVTHMKPIPKEHEDLIVSEGRKPYLGARVEVLPIDRFYYPASVSQGYGWTTSGMLRYLRRPRFGRSEEPMRQCFRRNNVGPDLPGRRQAYIFDAEGAMPFPAL